MVPAACSLIEPRKRTWIKGFPRFRTSALCIAIFYVCCKGLPVPTWSWFTTSTATVIRALVLVNGRPHASACHWCKITKPQIDAFKASGSFLSSRTAFFVCHATSTRIWMKIYRTALPSTRSSMLSCSWLVAPIFAISSATVELRWPARVIFVVDKSVSIPLWKEHWSVLCTLPGPLPLSYSSDAKNLPFLCDS